MRCVGLGREIVAGFHLPSSFLSDIFLPFIFISFSSFSWLFAHFNYADFVDWGHALSSSLNSLCKRREVWCVVNLIISPLYWAISHEPSTITVICIISYHTPPIHCNDSLVHWICIYFHYELASWYELWEVRSIFPGTKTRDINLNELWLFSVKESIMFSKPCIYCSTSSFLIQMNLESFVPFSQPVFTTFMQRNAFFAKMFWVDIYLVLYFPINE